MKKSRRIWWLVAGLLIFAGIILWAGKTTLEEGHGQGLGIAFLCIGIGLLIGLLLAIEWLVEFQKSFSFEKSEKKRWSPCEVGRGLLRKIAEADTWQAKEDWSAAWGIHKKNCPTCRQIKLKK